MPHNNDVDENKKMEKYIKIPAHSEKFFLEKREDLLKSPLYFMLFNITCNGKYPIQKFNNHRKNQVQNRDNQEIQPGRY